MDETRWVGKRDEWKKDVSHGEVGLSQGKKGWNIQKKEKLIDNIAWKMKHVSGTDYVVHQEWIMGGGRII